MSRFTTRRKCRHCSRFFLPDPRAAGRQRYCSCPDCQQASKLASQRRWLSKNGNGDYFRGPRAVERVQAWRKLHPGYWHRQTPRLGRVKLLIINQLTPVTPLVTYREDCRVRYKMRALRKILLLLGLSQW